MGNAIKIQLWVQYSVLYNVQYLLYIITRCLYSLSKSWVLTSLTSVSVGPTNQVKNSKVKTHAYSTHNYFVQSLQIPYTVLYHGLVLKLWTTKTIVLVVHDLYVQYGILKFVYFLHVCYDYRLLDLYCTARRNSQTISLSLNGMPYCTEQYSMVPCFIVTNSKQIQHRTLES